MFDLAIHYRPNGKCVAGHSDSSTWIDLQGWHPRVTIREGTTEITLFTDRDSLMMLRDAVDQSLHYLDRLALDKTAEHPSLPLFEMGDPVG